MIKLETYEVVGWKHAIRGMRNPMNSWDKSDSFMMSEILAEEELAPGVTAMVSKPCIPYFCVGPEDYKLMMKLRNAGTDHRKYMRMIVVYVDITAPLYWWKEFDTYKVGTVANSCSTMHKIHAKEFTLDDFSCDLLGNDDAAIHGFTSKEILELLIVTLNYNREMFIKTKDRLYWDQMIQLLPTSYNQKRTVMLNYEVLANIYKSRKNHKLTEWHTFSDWIKELPYSEIITGEEVIDK